MASLLALTDVMSTGYHAAVSADVQPGDTVAVVGDGAVGLSGVLSAKMLGAERIIVLGSTHEDRHQLAREWGATDIISVRGDEAIKALQDLTDGYGADAVLECVGTKEAMETAFAVATAGSDRRPGRGAARRQHRCRRHLLPQRRHARRSRSGAALPAGAAARPCSTVRSTRERSST